MELGEFLETYDNTDEPLKVGSDGKVVRDLDKMKNHLRRYITLLRDHLTEQELVLMFREALVKKIMLS
jgi:hypothetical protein